MLKWLKGVFSPRAELWGPWESRQAYMRARLEIQQRRCSLLEIRQPPITIEEHKAALARIEMSKGQVVTVRMPDGQVLEVNMGGIHAQDWTMAKGYVVVLEGQDRFGWPVGDERSPMSLTKVD